MFKVVAVVDKKGSAIDRLSEGIKPFMRNVEYVICDVHPKRPSPEQLQRFELEAKKAQIIDFQYFRTAEMLREKYVWLNDKKKILTHHNPYSINEKDWNEYDVVVGNNESIYDNLKNITNSELEFIPNTIDTDFWTFNQDWKPKMQVLMVAARIESKKGILPVAIAAQDAGLEFVLVGSISDREYFQTILDTGVRFYENIPDSQLKQLYYESMFHVCNSVDNFESGTLPILEAMMCGTPVVTRKIGHVPDLMNDKNMIVHESEPEEVADLIEVFKANMDMDKLKEVRQEAWNTAKSRSHRRRAWSYQKLYRKVMGKTSVSVIVPLHNNPDQTRECVNAIENQTHKNIEIILVDDGETQEDTVNQLKQFISRPLSYIESDKGDYGLARARNLGIIEATGELLVFCDQRMVMHEKAVEMFVKYAKHKHWLYGNKGSKRPFVENFSAIYRSGIIDAGMFNERITKYGGMSQEIRARTRNQGYTHEYVESAKAKPSKKSGNRYRKKEEIIEMKDLLWRMDLQ